MTVRFPSPAYASLATRREPDAVEWQLLADDLPRGPFRRSVEAISRELQGGRRLSDVLQDTSMALPASLAQVLRRETGHISTRLIQTWIEVERDRRDFLFRLWMAIAYPVITVVLSGLLLLLYNQTGLRHFHKIYVDFGVEVPLLTRWAVSLSDYLSSASGIASLLGLLMLLCIGLVFALRTWWLMDLFKGMPLVGRVLHFESLRRFCLYLAELLDAGMPLLPATAAASQLTEDPTLCHAMEQLNNSINTGLLLDDLLESSGTVPLDLVQPLRWAARSTAAGPMMRAMGENFAARRYVGVMQLSVIAQPVSLVVLGMIGLSAIAVTFLPMIKLLNDMS